MQSTKILELCPVTKVVLYVAVKFVTTYNYMYFKLIAEKSAKKLIPVLVIHKNSKC